MTDSIERQVLIEALRRTILNMPRYSFLLRDGGVACCPDRTGRWLERDAITNLLEPEMLDVIVAEEIARRALEKAKTAQD